MDRGVKIAIFVASIAALCLGLIWDQVLSHARVIVEDTGDDPLASEVMDASIGDPSFARLDPADELAPNFNPEPVDELPSVVEVADAPPVVAESTEYTVQDGDSWWKIANVRFKGRGLSSTDLIQANPDVKLVAGSKVKIPAGKQTSGSAPTEKPKAPEQPKPAQPAGADATEYAVQDGDSWWKIANVHFKGRGLSSDDLIAANPGVKIVVGNKIKIPAK